MMHRVALAGLLLLAAPASGIEQPQTRFIVDANEGLIESYTGRVYVMLGSSPRREPRHGPDWFNPSPFFGVDVVDWTPGTPIIFDEQSAGHPVAIDELNGRDWVAQAVFRGGENSSIGSGAGTVYSQPVTMQIHGDTVLVADTLDPGRQLPEVTGLEWVEFESPMLSRAAGRSIMHRAGVIAPKDYDPNEDRTWPVLYVIGGFPGSLQGASMSMWMWGSTGISKEAFIVHLDAETRTGHHAFIDSEGNGPRSHAFVEEFIPYLEDRYPFRPEPSGRLLTGHSSGGWASLWLQLNWPDVFGGTWSTAPDPVDFRDFQQINIYEEGANAFKDTSGQRRAVARLGPNRRIWYDQFVSMEAALGDGGQIRSFDWTFSPVGEDGKPRRLINPETGAIDPEVAEAWKACDINLFVQERWDEIGPRLEGKLHIVGGSEDTFYLDGALRKLQETLKALGSDAQVELVEGADHSNFMTKPRRRRMARDMINMFNQSP